MDLSSLEQIIDLHPLIVEAKTPLIEVIELMSQSWMRSCCISEDNLFPDESLVTPVHTSCALVMSNSQLIGIFTERDIVRLIATGITLTGMTITEVMSRQLITLKATEFENVFATLSLLHRNRIRHLPVVNENNQLLGLITLESLRKVLQPLDLLKFRRVVEVMSTQVIHAPPTSTLLDLANLMTQYRVSYVVITADSQVLHQTELRPLGIITERDLVQFRLLELNLELIQAEKVMSTPLFLASPEDSLWSVYQQMQRHRVRRLVVAGLQGELVGIVTQTSLLRMLDPIEMCTTLELLQQKVHQLESEKFELLQQRSAQLERQVPQEQNQTQPAETELERFFNLSLDMLCIAGLDGYFKQLNSAFEKTLGYTKAELLAEPFLNFVHPDDRTATLAEIEKLGTGQPTIYFENRYRCKDSSYRWLAWTSYPFIEQDLLYAIARDITQRKRAEAALQESNLLLGTISSIQSQVLADAEPRILFDRLLESLLELTQSEYGFIGEILYGSDGTPHIEEAYMKVRGQPYLKTHAITNIAWNEETRAFYEQHAPTGMEFHNLKTLFGTVIVTGKPVIANNPNSDPRRGGLPKGHPPLNAFLGVPFYQNKEMTGMVGIANRPGGYNQALVDYLEPFLSTCSRIIEAYRNHNQKQQAERKVREQAALLDIATDAILVKGLDGQISFWNRGAECLYGWTTAEVLGENANELLYPEFLPSEAEIHQVLFAKGEWQGELYQVTKSGQKIIVESHWTLVRDRQGNPKSILVVNSDITKKKQLESQLLRTQRLESIGTLAGGIAHDLNNILTPILMSSQLLGQTLPQIDERSQRLLEILEANAKRASAIVKQVLSFARGVEGEHKVLQVGHILWEIKDFAQHTFPKFIEVQTNIPKNLWTIQGDATQIHQLLMNLCVNARDAMPHGGILSISAENLSIDEHYAGMNIEAEVGPHIKITVADTGTGIPQNLIDRIFEPFFTTKGVGQGTGLGLATVIGIVKSHHGFVKVYSEVGRGTQFRVYLPSLEAAELELAPDQNLPLGNGELILVVDDETPIREITKTSLESHNYRVITASDGIEAIALYAQHQQQISVVLMDLVMPSMDGLTAMRTLQKLNPQVKFIAVSGLAQSNKMDEALKLGINASLSKPYTARELLLSLCEVITDRPL